MSAFDERFFWLEGRSAKGALDGSFLELRIVGKGESVHHVLFRIRDRLGEAELTIDAPEMIGDVAAFTQLSELAPGAEFLLSMGKSHWRTVSVNLDWLLLAPRI